jgi:hypothetical protein
LIDTITGKATHADYEWFGRAIFLSAVLTIGTAIYRKMKQPRGRFHTDALPGGPRGRQPAEHGGYVGCEGKGVRRDLARGDDFRAVDESGIGL